MFYLLQRDYKAEDAQAWCPRHDFVSGQNSCACPVDPTIVHPTFKLGNYEVDEVIENEHVQRDVKFEVRGKNC